MYVDLEFHHPEYPELDHSQGTDLAVLPRIGEWVLWSDTVPPDPATGDEVRYREYVVVGVDWSMSPDGPGAAVRLRLDFIGYR